MLQRRKSYGENIIYCRKTKMANEIINHLILTLKEQTP